MDLISATALEIEKLDTFFLMRPSLIWGKAIISSTLNIMSLLEDSYIVSPASKSRTASLKLVLSSGGTWDWICLKSTRMFLKFWIWALMEFSGLRISCETVAVR